MPHKIDENKITNDLLKPKETTPIDSIEKYIIGADKIPNKELIKYLLLSHLKLWSNVVAKHNQSDTDHRGAIPYFTRYPWWIIIFKLRRKVSINKPKKNENTKKISSFLWFVTLYKWIIIKIKVASGPI